MELFDHVLIKASSVRGIIVDIHNDRFTVEADHERKEGDTEGYPGLWPLYFCAPDELELIDKN